MFHRTLTGLSKTRFRTWLALFFLALAIPTAVLVRQAYSQLKWETFHQHQVLAEELSSRIDSRASQLINTEEVRTFTDFGFVVVAGDPSVNFLQRSPLSNFPANKSFPGLIGYFQVDAQGIFSTPLLPQPGNEAAEFGISTAEFTQRMALQARIHTILSQNRLLQGRKPEGAAQQRQMIVEPESLQDAIVSSIASKISGQDSDLAIASEPEFDSPPAVQEEQVRSQAAFDKLNEIPKVARKKQKTASVGKLGRVDDLKLDKNYQSKQAALEKKKETATFKPIPAEKRASRKERSALPERSSISSGAAQETQADSQAAIRVRTFESEIDPFEFSLLDSGHFVLYRKVWRDGQRYIQGFLVDQRVFLQEVVETVFRNSAISQMSNLIVAYQGDVLVAFRGASSRQYFSSVQELTGELLYQTSLSDPLNGVELIYTVTRLPAGPGSSVITWITLILSAVLMGGFYFMYRLGVKQIDLARQQQDFVSAVSHELKTPLTSIRMYGEMLREGWATDDKKMTYYDYIYDESERLSRLINNVLQLARMTRNDLRVDLKPAAVAELMDGIRSKVTTQIDRAGFSLNLKCSDKVSSSLINVDADFFTQIIINLVDNALKFSKKSETKKIDVTCELFKGSAVLFSVRDYGPGVPKDQMKKIFKLFYRSENELTRETVGTGIGLALVYQLASAMKGKVDVLNREPGAEFKVYFPL